MGGNVILQITFGSVKILSVHDHLVIIQTHIVFNTHFILVRVVVYVDPIQGRLHMRLKYTQNALPYFTFMLCQYSFMSNLGLCCTACYTCITLHVTNNLLNFNLSRVIGRAQCTCDLLQPNPQPCMYREIIGNQAMLRSPYHERYHAQKLYTGTVKQGFWSSEEVMSTH